MRWGVNYVADNADRYGRVHAEEGSDLRALLAETKQDRAIRTRTSVVPRNTPIG
ncbi:hypothetical protein FraQA3DRAFT_2764 [Frankia sp. QA3]|nr:hypothetical protein FraQA3DRAFT_2764 [Frankia sp. QA3]